MHNLLGFFVVEDHILNTGNGLVDRTYLDELWAFAIGKIVNALRTHSVSDKLHSDRSESSLFSDGLFKCIY